MAIQDSADKYVSIISSISGVAASSVEGVASISTDPGAMLDSFIGKRARSIRVDTVGNNAVIDITINARYGYKIPELVARIQEKVKSEVEKATFYKVKSVNINIAGVVFNN